MGEGVALIRADWEIRPPGGGPPIRGDLRAPRGPVPRTAVVLCHGFKGFKDWAFLPHLARALARRGHAVISFNLSRCGVGADGVDFSALELFAEQTHTRNLEETRLVLDAVTGRRLLPVKPRRLGLFGFSRGGGEAILTAAEDRRVHALVTWAAIGSVDRYGPEQVTAWERGETVSIPNLRTGQQMPIGPEFWSDLRLNRERLDVLRAAGRVAVPWLIVHGEQDETVPVEEARRLFAGSSAPGAELLLVEGTGHTFGAVHPFAGEGAALAIAREATLRWFDRHLAP